MGYPFQRRFLERGIKNCGSAGLSHLTSETMLSNRSNLPLCQVSMFNTSPISRKCDITVRTCKLLRHIIPLEEIDRNCLQLSYALFFGLIHISLTFSERDVGTALSYRDKNHFGASISRKTNFKSSIWKWQRRHFWKLREVTLPSSWRHDGLDQQTKWQPRREPWEWGWQNEQTTKFTHPRYHGLFHLRYFENGPLKRIGSLIKPY